MTQYTQPAEWHKHESCWTAWPSHSDLWQEDLIPAQKEFVKLARAIADVDSSGKPRGEKLNILIPDKSFEGEVGKALGLPDGAYTFHVIPFGDIWLRDTAPIFVNRELSKKALNFKFNGWGGKYVLPFDDQVASSISKKLKCETQSFDFILEGGAIEPDGEGTCLTTEQCLLNKNRNPGFTKEKIEDVLKSALGYSKILWLKEGLVNDHTDGHIDTLVRFVKPGMVVCMRASQNSDPHKKYLDQIHADLKKMTDARGRRLEIIEIPSPGPVYNSDGDVMPASYVNFYISNTSVIVPTYGTKNDSLALSLIGKCFPERRTIGLSARAILEGGGAFHCITQQEPLVES